MSAEQVARQHLVVMGVSGTGKTTVGSALAARLSMPFVEGDRLHPEANIAKMSAGVPLDDDDRRPWLQRLGAELARYDEAGQRVVLTCSALKRGYRDLLRLFFAFHDPTTVDRQGPDVGTQYRSVIFPHSPAQAATAREVIAELSADGVFEDPIVTEVTPLGLDQVWAAEEKHQQYYRRNPDQMYCRFQVAPKVAKLRKHYAGLLRTS